MVFFFGILFGFQWQLIIPVGLSLFMCSSSPFSTVLSSFSVTSAEPSSGKTGTVNRNNHKLRKYSFKQESYFTWKSCTSPLSRLQWKSLNLATQISSDHVLPTFSQWTCQLQIPHMEELTLPLSWLCILENYWLQKLNYFGKNWV